MAFQEKLVCIGIQRLPDDIMRIVKVYLVVIGQDSKSRDIRSQQFQPIYFVCPSPGAVGAGAKPMNSNDDITRLVHKLAPMFIGDRRYCRSHSWLIKVGVEIWT